jgi:hypothetical protein
MQSGLLNRKTEGNMHSIFNLAGQAVVGSSLALGFSILPTAASFGSSWAGEQTSATIFGILAISAYLAGSATGVHWIAKIENPNLSFWNTLGYSAIGGGVGALTITILATQYTTLPAFGTVIAFLCPVMSSMIYAALIADWDVTSKENDIVKYDFSHKNLIDYSKVFDVEIVRIRF